eukprot:6276901-Pyramimonas_sp.AAC.1
MTAEQIDSDESDTVVEQGDYEQLEPDYEQLEPGEAPDAPPQGSVHDDYEQLEPEAPDAPPQGSGFWV